MLGKKLDHSTGDDACDPKQAVAVANQMTAAGVKLDVVAGRGIGVVGALFAAIDGAPRLWEDHGFWRT